VVGNTVQKFSSGTVMNIHCDGGLILSIPNDPLGFYKIPNPLALLTA